MLREDDIEIFRTSGQNRLASIVNQREERLEVVLPFFVQEESRGLIRTISTYEFPALKRREAISRSAVIGGIFATAGFALLQRLFELYLIKSAVLKGVYGAFSVFPVFLVWLHLCWAVVLFGGLIAARAFRQA